VQLPLEVKLEGEFEVALSEIIFPKNWNNIIDGHNELIVHKRDEFGQIDKKQHVIWIPPGNYEDALTLAREITSRARNVTYIQDFVVTVNRKANRLEYKKPARWFVYTRSAELAGMFGMTQHDEMRYVPPPITNSQIQRAPLGDRLNLEPYPVMFAYTDIIEYQIVGTTQAPLLRAFDTEGQHGEAIVKPFIDPHYKKVTQKILSAIEIRLTDAFGQNIAFLEGHGVTVTLHFRRKKV
jgi:hypothetical protein